jgi:hypothetical protein
MTKAIGWPVIAITTADTNLYRLYPEATHFGVVLDCHVHLQTPGKIIGRRFRRESITPFGLAVVPPVSWMIARFSVDISTSGVSLPTYMTMIIL